MKHRLMLCAVTLAALCPAIPGDAEEKQPDPPTGVCPGIMAVLQEVKTGAPDPAAYAAVLKAYGSSLGNSRSSPEVTRKRVFALVDLAVRRFTADALDIAKLPQEAAKLRALAPVTDEKTSAAASDAAKASATVAGNAAENAQIAAEEALATFQAALAAAQKKKHPKGWDQKKIDKKIADDCANEKAQFDKTRETAGILKAASACAGDASAAANNASIITKGDGEADIHVLEWVTPLGDRVAWLKQGFYSNILAGWGKPRLPKEAKGDWELYARLMLDTLLAIKDAPAPGGKP